VSRGIRRPPGPVPDFSHFELSFIENFLYNFEHIKILMIMFLFRVRIIYSTNSGNTRLLGFIEEV